MGNLLGRTTAKSINANQEFPNAGQVNLNQCSQQAKDLMNQAECLADSVHDTYASFNYYLGVDLIMDLLRNCNMYIQEEKPWELRKTDTERLQLVLLVALECLRISGILLQPIVPLLSQTLLSKLGVPHTNRDWSDAKSFAWNSEQTQLKLSSEKVILFQKIKE